MWTKIAHFVLKNRLTLIIFLGLITVFMAYKASNLRTSFKFAELVPLSDYDMKKFIEFKKTFGEDANMLVIGFDDSLIYKKDQFNHFIKLNKSIAEITGVNSVLSLSTLNRLVVNNPERKFNMQPYFDREVATQEELDSLLTDIKATKFFEGQIFAKNSEATLIALSIDKNILNSKKRQEVIKAIQNKVNIFYNHTGIEAHYAGMPYVRSILTSQVQAELKLFLFLSLAVTAIILFLFFRSFYAVLFPIIVIGISVVWTMGSIVLFGYEMSMLTGLIPPIIVVIGIPNCIYLLNKYHQEFVKSGNKIKALSTVVRKIGIVTLITNMTTSIGFAVLISADITILKEFGIIAGLNVISTFFISIILIPAVFSYLPKPNTKELKHLDFKSLTTVLAWLEHIVLYKRNLIYTITAIIVLISAWGSWKVYAVSYMVDDIPESSSVKKDLRFFEKEFGGAMPIEIILDIQDKANLKDLVVLNKIDEFQGFLASIPELTTPISVINFIKSARQAYWNNHPDFYTVPTNQDKNKVLSYLNKSTGDDVEAFNSFVDSTGKIRVSLKVADIGSIKMDSLINQVIKPEADRIFASNDTDKVQISYHITGTTLLFIKGIRFLLDNLRESIVIAILLISIIMAVLFRSVKMILISLIPNLIPLLITGALMGYFGIPLKPSTALIFSIAFGISVDDSIHYLAKFRQELIANNHNLIKAVAISIRETGLSMIYTSIVLFGGFLIFAGSNFLGTVMLGILTSTTLLCAMLTNLIVLPSLLLTFGGIKKEDIASSGLITSYTDDNEEDDDEVFDDTTSTPLATEEQTTNTQTEEDEAKKKETKSKLIEQV